MQLVPVSARPLGAVHTFVFRLRILTLVFIPTLVLNLHPNYKSNKGNLLRFFSHAICVFTVTKKPFVDRAYSLFIEAIFLFDEKSEHEV